MTFPVSHQPPLNGSDEYWMQKALSQAEKAYSIGEVPVGAVVVIDGSCVGAGHNRSITDSDPCAHAEVMAIRDAAKKIGNYRLNDARLFVTLEPCLMCIGAIIHARVNEVIFSAKDPKTGVLGSQINCCKFPFINHVPVIRSGVLESESSDLLKNFFQERRQQNKNK